MEGGSNVKGVGVKEVVWGRPGVEMVGLEERYGLAQEACGGARLAVASWQLLRSNPGLAPLRVAYGWQWIPAVVAALRSKSRAALLGPKSWPPGSRSSQWRGPLRQRQEVFWAQARASFETNSQQATVLLFS